MTDFYAADVGRQITASGGVGIITAVVDGATATVQVVEAFPATAFDSGDWRILGSPQTTLTPSAKDPVGSTITLTLTLAGWRDDDVGKFVRINGGLCRITEKTSDTIVNAVIESELASNVAAPTLAWSLESSVWGGRNGYPRCGALYEQRLVVGGSPGSPLGFWGSTIGEFFDFLLGTLDDQAFAYVLASGEYNPIQHLVTARGLLALTSGGEFSIRGGQEKALTPTNIQVTDQSAFGTSEVPPQRVANEVFLVQRTGKKVRALTANQYDGTQYDAPDMSVLAEHVTAPGIVSMARQQEPDALVWAVRADGQLATLTADRDQEVFAWARQVTQGNFECVETVPTPDGDRLFAVVRRIVGGVGVRYIEMLDPDLNTDAALTGTSEAGATVWSGLDHLEGLTVTVKGDGIALQDRVVTGGAITIERAANTIEIGLGYVSTVMTLTPEVSVPVGTAQGANLSIHEVSVRLRDTIGSTINLQEVSFRKYGADVLDRAPAPYTGIKKAGNLGWGEGEAQTLIQQTLPYDFHLLSVVSKITINEG